MRIIKEQGMYMFIQKKKIKYYHVIILFIFALCSCRSTKDTAVEIEDLNGSWMADWIYKGRMERSPEKRELGMHVRVFSWGEGLAISNTTNHFDITADEPFYLVSGVGRFGIIEINQIGKSSIKVRMYQGDLDDPDFQWIIEPVFHFLDKDTYWIESEELENGSILYGKDALWHRLSGPGRLNVLIEKIF